MMIIQIILKPKKMSFVKSIFFQNQKINSRKTLFKILGIPLSLYFITNNPCLAKDEGISFTSIDTTAIRLEVVNGFLDFKSKIYEADIDISWQVWPENTELDKKFFRDFREPYIIEIRNENLGRSKKWSQDIIDSLNNSKLNGNLSSEDIDKAKKEISEALLFDGDIDKISKNLTEYNKNAIIEKFRKKILGEEYQKNIQTSKMTAIDWFGLNWEFEKIVTLLDSNGIEYFFDVKKVKTLKRYPERSDSNIKWKIKIYPFKLDNSQKYYRYSITALMSKKRVQFVKSTSEEDAQINVAVKFKEDPDKKTVSVKDILSASISSEIPDFKEITQKITKIEDADSVSSELGFLGKTVKGLVSGGFLAGSSNSTIISGALIDINEEEIVPLAGINWNLFKISKDLSGGVTFGVEPSGDASIFVGPSISLDVATFSLGTRVTGNNNDLSFNLSGLVSVDISRLFGNRVDQALVPCTEKNTCIVGGNFFKSADALLEAQAFVGWNLLDSKDSREKVFLEKVPLTPEESLAAPFKFEISRGIKNRIIPKGKYRFNIQASQLKDEDGNIHYPSGYFPFEKTIDNSIKVVNKYFKIENGICKIIELSESKPFDWNNDVITTIGKLELQRLNLNEVREVKDFDFYPASDESCFAKEKTSKKIF